MNKLSISNYTKRNKFTRMCIGEAMVALMKEKSYSKIKILDLAVKAGVSRMTFYKYYHTKDEVLNDYLNEIISGYIDIYDTSTSSTFPNYENILNALIYFDKYSNFFVALCNAGLYSLLINATNEYLENIVVPKYGISLYKAYYFAGAILNTFIKWEENGKIESPEKIAHQLC